MRLAWLRKEHSQMDLWEYHIMAREDNMEYELPNGIIVLREWLGGQATGPIADIPELTPLLIDAWNDLRGSSAESTDSTKLSGRIENATWNPPILEFNIERHGGTVCGSSRAAIHRWTIDAQKCTAFCNPNFSYRQIRKAAKPLNTDAIAETIAAAIVGQKAHPSLRWYDQRERVRVQLKGLINANNKQSRDGRRKQFRKTLESLLDSNGWIPAPGRAAYTYSRKPSAT